MAKTRKHHRSSKRHGKSKFARKLRKTTAKALPAIKKGLKNVGESVSKAAKKSAPAIKKGTQIVLSKLSEGFDLGVQSAQTGIDKLHNSLRKSKRKHH
jgi:hypothetical protein